MKGLFIKDLCLMKMQKRFFIVLTVLSVIMAFTEDNTSFVIGYLAMVMPLFSLSTISYDEFDNGNAFLFTLPITRTVYVAEKYCFGALLGTAALILGTGLTLCAGGFKKEFFFEEIIASLLPIFAVMLVMLSVMIPIQLKFGAERGRIAILAVFGGLFALGFGIYKLVPNAEEIIIKMLDYISKMDIALLIVCVALAVCAVLAVSFALSVKIMNKKEL